MADHEVMVRVRIENFVAMAVPENVPVMRVGDTVHYVSPDGAVDVEFETPVTDRGAIVRSGETATLTQGGIVFCKCSITLPGGAKIAWSDDNPKSGGVHDVRPRPGFE